MAVKEKESSGYGKTDIGAMRADGRQGQKLPNQYSLSDGEHRLRLLPPKETGQFYYKFYQHQLGNAWVVCPQHTWGEKCPVCILGDRLHNSKDPDEVEKGGKLYRRETYLANVIDWKNPDRGVQVIRFGVKLRDALADMFVEPNPAEGIDGIDLTDTEKGTVLRINSGKGPGGYNQHIPSILQMNVGIPYKRWVKELKDLKGIVREMTKDSEELQRLMVSAGATYGNESEGNEDLDLGETRYKAKEAAEKQESSGSSIKKGMTVTGEDDDGDEHTGKVLDVDEDLEEVEIEDSDGDKHTLELKTVKAAEPKADKKKTKAEKVELEKGMRVKGEDEDGDEFEGKVLSVDEDDGEVIIKDSDGDKHILQLKSVKVAGEKKGKKKAAEDDDVPF